LGEKNRLLAQVPYDDSKAVKGDK